MKRACHVSTITILIFVFFSANVFAAGSVKVANLRCEYLEDPLGIDVTRPRLSWRLASDQRGQRQTAYHLLVASSPETLAQNMGDLWDTGKVESDQSIHVVYDGKELTSRMQCFWKVMAWPALSQVEGDKDSRASHWSEPAQWSMGLLKLEDWTAKWITNPAPKRLSHPWLRRTFDLKKDVDWAVIHVNTPSYYELRINGQKVTPYVLTPGISKLDKRFLVNSYDVSSYLVKGSNCISLWMGPGWHQPRNGNKYNAPILRAQLDIHSPSGLTVVGTDSSWRVKESCITQIGEWKWNNFGGEHFDAREFVSGWDQVRFDDSQWDAALEIPAPVGWFDRVQNPEDGPGMTASSNTPGYLPASAVDGSDKTRWVSNGDKPGMGPTAEKPEYLQFDYEQAQSFSGLYLKPSPYCGPKKIEIQYSDDDKTYRTIKRATLKLGVESTVQFDEVQAVHWRVVFLSAYPFRGDKSWNVQVAEIDFLPRKQREPLKASRKIEHSWQGCEGARPSAPVSPKKISQLDNGKWVIDFGRPLTGWMRLDMHKLKAGQEVHIDYADLNDNGNERKLSHKPGPDGFQTFNQKDIFISAGEDKETFCSRFNYHSFRYVVIAGLSQKPAIEDAVAMMIEPELDSAGTFECSNELFNQIHEITRYTFRTQNPCLALGTGEAREKSAYGDGGAHLSGYLYNFKCDANLRKWIRDWSDNQREDGFLEHTAPAFEDHGGGPPWGGQLTELVRRMCLYYGDEKIVEQTYDTLRKYVDYVESKTEDGILRAYSPTNGSIKWRFIGDWVRPTEELRGGFYFDTMEEREFFNNCYRALLWQQLQDYAEVLGRDDEFNRCREHLAKIRPLIHKTFYLLKEGTYSFSNQGSLTMALYADIPPQDLRPQILAKLEHDIVVEKNGHLDTGLLSSFLMLDLLNKEDRNDLIALIMSQTTYPGWGFLVEEMGLNTWPETWSGWGSHVILVTATPGAWFFEGLGGILPDLKHPGFKHFTLRPGIVNSVDWVNCSYQSPYGEIVSNWMQKRGSFAWDVSVPPNASATIHVPGKNITEGRLPAAKAEGVTFLRMEKNRAVFSVESGTYRFVSKNYDGN